MAEARPKAGDLSEKTATDNLKAAAQHHTEESDLIMWYLNAGIDGFGTNYNQWAEAMWNEFNIHMCILDKGDNVKQYSTKYTGLIKYNPAWVGFYPSVYDIQQVIDLDGNTQPVKIKDTDQLKNLHTLQKASKFYFAGWEYKLIEITKKSDENFICFGFDKETKSIIVIRKALNGCMILNCGTRDSKGRQKYGSDRAVYNILMNYLKKIGVDFERTNGQSFFEEGDEAENQDGF